MLQRIHHTEHLGPEFLKAEYTSSYATRDVIKMNYIKLEEKSIGMNEDARELAILFATSLLP